jgi:hypothetical protein
MHFASASKVFGPNLGSLMCWHSVPAHLPEEVMVSDEPCGDLSSIDLISLTLEQISYT